MVRRGICKLIFQICVASAVYVPFACAAQSTELHRAYEKNWAPRLVPMLTEVVRFQTFAGNDPAFADQKIWLADTAKRFGFSFKDAGKFSEIELPGPVGAPVLGLVVHGDVVPVDNNWTFPPFEVTVRNGMVQGRGVADDKGPLVQALLAMKVLQDSGKPRTHTIRLLVGSDEESGSSDIGEYLASHKPPDLSLVLDSAFPVVVGEKAVNTLYVNVKLDDRGDSPIRLTSIVAGIATNIVPDLAVAKVEARTTVDAPVAKKALDALRRRLELRPLADGIRLETEWQDNALLIRTKGKAAHAGVNAIGGRNALVALAGLLESELPQGGARALLAFTKLAGQDLSGTALGISESHPVFGLPVVVPTLFRTTAEGNLRLAVNIRSNPGASGAPLKELLLLRIREFNASNGSSLEGSGGFTSTPLVHNIDAKIVKRLLAIYERTTGVAAPPAISAGGTYAKRLPNSIVFGMWFPGKPYPGHDVDEKISVEDLQKGARVLVEALLDIACGDPIREPFVP